MPPFIIPLVRNLFFAVYDVLAVVIDSTANFIDMDMRPSRE